MNTARDALKLTDIAMMLRGWKRETFGYSKGDEMWISQGMAQELIFALECGDNRVDAILNG